MGSCVCKGSKKTGDVSGDDSFTNRSHRPRATSGVRVQQDVQSGRGHASNPPVVRNGGGVGDNINTERQTHISHTGPHNREIRIVIGENLRSPMIDCLVFQTLAIIRTLVDNEQPPPEAMMQLHKIADVEIGWLAIVYSMISNITTSDPLGPAVITLILDECPLPSKEAVMKLTVNLNVSKESAVAGKMEPMKQRNICILYGFLAEKLAGPTSVTLLTDQVLQYLIENLETDKAPFVILHAIVALEKFALTSENKLKVIEKLNSCKRNALLSLEDWRYSKDNTTHREVGFCAEWALDNLFVPHDRLFTYEKAHNENLNAMLNSNDTSEYLKISTDGLEARSDVLSFESVRCTFQIDSGAWYYEVELVTNGVLQIGWATKNSKFLNYDGYGIGDDEFSLAYDGCRQLIWHNAQSHKHAHSCWHPGDVLGCYLDVDAKVAIFSLNGNELPPLNQIFQNARKGFFAAASFMTFQQCIFNFGGQDFKHSPNRPFQTFNEKGTLTDDERVVLPRHKKIEILRRMSVKEDGCQLCFDNQASVTLKPCAHSGFCSTCALQLEICPLCRKPIELIITESTRKSTSSYLRTQLSIDRSVSGNTEMNSNSQGPNADT